MKLFLFCLALMFILLGCKRSCDLEFYKRVSGISFPNKYTVVECKDNDEFMSAMILKVESNDVEDFCKSNYFKKVPKGYVINFMGAHLLDTNNLNFPSNSALYIKTGRTKINTWYYLLDKNSGKLWAEVQYPDWSGDAP